MCSVYDDFSVRDYYVATFISSLPTRVQHPRYIALYYTTHLCRSAVYRYEMNAGHCARCCVLFFYQARATKFKIHVPTLRDW